MQPARTSHVMVVLGWLLTLSLIFAVLWWAPVAETIAAARSIELSFLVAGMIAACGSLWLRGGRWALLFSPYHRVASTSCAAVAIIGLALNATLPAKFGEVGRVALGARRFGTGVSLTAATVIAERLLDALVLLGLAGVTLVVLPMPANRVVRVLGHEVDAGFLVAAFRAGLLAAAVLALLVMVATSRRLHARIDAFLARGRSRGAIWLRPRLAGFLSELARGVAALRRPRLVAGLVGYSVAIWLGLALCNWCVAHGFDGLSLSFTQALLFTVTSIAAASLPSAPGAWGLFEAGGLLALVAMGVEFDPATGAAYVFAAHLAQYLPSVVIGAVLLARQGLWSAVVLEPGLNENDSGRE